MDFVKAGRFPSKNQSFWRLMGKRDKKRMQQGISKLCLAKCFNLSREVFWPWMKNPWSSMRLRSFCELTLSASLVQHRDWLHQVKRPRASRKDLASVFEKQEFECYSDILRHFDTASSCGSCLLQARDEKGVRA